jgi:hypothetical protein
MNIFISLTALSYIFLSVPLGLLTYRFFQYWRQRKDTTSKLFFFLIVCLFSFVFTRAVTTLFFFNNKTVLIFSVFLVLFFEGLSASFIGCLIAYLKFSKIHAWLGFIIFFLPTILAMTLLSNMQYDPVLVGKLGTIDWGFPDTSISSLDMILRTAIIVISFSALISIMLRQAGESSDPIVKKRSWGLSLVLFFGMMIGFFDFIFTSILKMNLIYRDFSVILTAVLLLAVILITQKPPTKE